MGDHHMHITSVLIEDQADIDNFLTEARRVFQYAWHVPVQGQAWAVAMVSKDFDGESSELEMEDICTGLGGILKGDIDLVSAWENDDGTRERTRLWHIKGSGR